MKKLLFFSTPHCVKCTSLKNQMTDIEGIDAVSIEHVDASTPSGLSQAQKFGVTGVPYLVLFDGEIELGVAKDIDELENLLL
ncbi:MAG: thioredoxin family protein [Candidatus Woesearchaeota archaeon]